jgi:phenylalanyl-tRNA synthetase beta chain
MKISYKWLLELTGLDWPVEEVADRLTLCGTACEDIVSTARYMNNVVVAEVKDVQPVEGADKIRRATVNTGTETLELICGAPNVAAGQKVPVALVGAEVAGGLKIKKTKIRGIESAGMICSEAELGISEDHSGIMVLDTSAKPGTPLARALDYDDYILDFELTPNRADSMSAIGIARDLAALASVKLRKPGYDIHESSERSSDYISVAIDDPEACPRFTARIIKNVTVGPSPWWIQQRLITAGIRPISNVVDITNLIMLETGNPLHAFDLEQFGSDRVLVRRASKGEKFVTLDGDEHELIEDNLLVTNGSEGMAAAGVMGGLHSGINSNTKTILLEAAYFNPSVIRKSRRHVGLVTESSQRFEKGVDPNNVPRASNRAAYLFQEICGGEVLDGLVDTYPKKIEPVTLSLRPSRCTALLGYEIPVDRMKQILGDLEFDVSGDDPIKAVAPTFRHDMQREVDLIEEVARIEGYHSIPDSTSNIGPLFTPIHRRDAFEDEMRSLMAAAGFDEIMGHGLAHSKDASKLDKGAPQVRIINPVSEDLDIMRNSLLLSALPVISHNIAHRNLDLQLFEIGKAYFPPTEKRDWEESDRLFLSVTGQTPATWRDTPRPVDFYDLIGALEALAGHFNLPELTFAPSGRPFLETGAAFDVRFGVTTVGYAGLLAKKAAAQFDVKQDVYVAELSLAQVFELQQGDIEFRELPIYPAAPRDLAIIVDEAVQAGDMLNAIRETAGDLAESVEIFDLYTGKQIPPGKKSVAFSIKYRSLTRSLSSEEVEKVQQDVISAVKQRFNAEIRDK